MTQKLQTFYQQSFLWNCGSGGPIINRHRQLSFTAGTRSEGRDIRSPFKAGCRNRRQIKLFAYTLRHILVILLLVQYRCTVILVKVRYAVQKIWGVWISFYNNLKSQPNIFFCKRIKITVNNRCSKKSIACKMPTRYTVGHIIPLQAIAIGATAYSVFLRRQMAARALGNLTSIF